MMTTEMMNVIDTMYANILTDETLSVDDACSMACAQCPYADRCHADELFYGCGVWEDSMGDDL